jgi:hypothetical protein
MEKAIRTPPFFAKSILVCNFSVHINCSSSIAEVVYLSGNQWLRQFEQLGADDAGAQDGFAGGVILWEASLQSGSNGEFPKANVTPMVLKAGV